MVHNGSGDVRRARGRPVSALACDGDLAATWEELRRRSPKLKVVYASGYSEEMAGKKLRLIEGENYLAKPISVKLLLKQINCILKDKQHAGPQIHP